MAFSFFGRNDDDRTDGVAVHVGKDEYDVRLLPNGPVVPDAGDDGIARRTASALELFPWGFAVTGTESPSFDGPGKNRVDLAISEPVDDDIVRYVYVIDSPQSTAETNPWAQEATGEVNIGTIEGRSSALHGLDKSVARDKISQLSRLRPGGPGDPA